MSSKQESSSESSDTDTANDLRLQGNDAFGTQDYARALKLYQQSVKQHEEAKTYGNIAATLCKLDQYSEALEAAERACTLDPEWAKGWWRRGVVSELLQMFAKALKYYEMAAKLDPKEKTFSKARRDMEKRLSIQKKKVQVNGKALPVVQLHDVNNNAKTNGTKPNITDVPVVRAWFQAREIMMAGGGATTAHVDMVERYIASQTTYPTSQQWLVQGMQEWVSAMKCSIASLALTVSRDAQRLWLALNQNTSFTSQEQALRATEQLLGGMPSYGQDMAHLMSAFAHLGGVHLVMEFNPNSEMYPAPPCLRGPQYLAYEALAVFRSVDIGIQSLVQERGFGPNIKLCKALVDVKDTLYTNLRVPCPYQVVQKKEQDPSPKEIIEYIQDELQSGRKTWDEMRVYISVTYRGAILYAAIVRLMIRQQVAEAYKIEKWANDFIDLADETFQVTEEDAYREKGSSFQYTLRIGAKMSQLHSLEMLRGDAVNGPYSMEMVLDLCVDIIDMADEIDIDHHCQSSAGGYAEYMAAQFEVAYRRKPLALAHSTIGRLLGTINSLFNLKEFKQIAAHHELIESIDDECDPHDLIAEHYKIAAENELPDADDGAIYWWSYAANMALAQLESGYTLGQMRYAISKAEAASKVRDLGLFGQDKHSGGQNENVAKVTAHYFQGKPDSFVLPQIKLDDAGGKLSLQAGKEVICPDFVAYEQKTKGATDGAEIQYKAMMAAMEESKM